MLGAPPRRARPRRRARAQAGAAWDPYTERRIKLGGLQEYIPTIRRGRRLMFVACGTSYHACLACRQTMEEIAEMPVRRPPLT